MLDPRVVRVALSAHPIRTLSPEGLRPAAVLLLFYPKDGRDTLLLTLRTDAMPHHRGEISFPGGGRHPEDQSLQQTALRETEEEMGIREEDIVLLGRLDDFRSVHGYHVVPFVGTLTHPSPFRVNREEIAEVFEVPLDLFLDPAIHRAENWRHRGRFEPVHFYTVAGIEVWGLTAAILRQFLQRLGLLRGEGEAR